jgi:mRNA interferase RelE/StbE
MIKYIEDIVKRVKKGLIPMNVFIHFNNAFKSIDITKDLELFDIKKLTTKEEFKHVYYRLRKGKYRAIFYIESNDIYIVALDKREDVYKKWQ